VLLSSLFSSKIIDIHPRTESRETVINIYGQDRSKFPEALTKTGTPNDKINPVISVAICSVHPIPEYLILTGKTLLRVTPKAPNAI
jgi:hypothetical protein